MSSITIADLIGAYSLSDFVPGKTQDQDDAGFWINEAIKFIASQTPYGVLFIPPRTYRIRTTIHLIEDISLIGLGSQSLLKLGPGANVNILEGLDISNVRLANFKIDGNRANNSSGNGQGLLLSGVSDVWLDKVEVTACRADGFVLNDSERVEITSCRAWSNGNSGYLLYNSRYNVLMACRAYDNCRVATAGTKDGIRLENMSQYNTIIAPICYELALAGQLQGYGVREATGESVQANSVIGGVFLGNVYGGVYLEGGDSVAVTVPLVSIPSGVIITP